MQPSLYPIAVKIYIINKKQKTEVRRKLPFMHRKKLQFCTSVSTCQTVHEKLDSKVVK